MTGGNRPPLLIVGWDGVELRRLRWLLKSGHMPNLRRLAKQGRDGNVVITPPLSPTACWTTLLTGVPALEHRVMTEVEPDGEGDLRPVLSTSRRRRALWNYATAAGLRGAYLGFPASAPAEPIQGAMISDRFCEQSGQAGTVWPTGTADVSPADRYEDFCDLVVRPDEIQPEEVIALVGDPTTVGSQANWLCSLVAETLAVTSTVHNLATSLMEEGGYDLCAVRYRSLLTIERALLGAESHRLGLSGEQYRWASGCVHACYGLLDMMLGRLLELIGPDANMLVISNMGFEPELRLISEELEDSESDLDLGEEFQPTHDPHRHFTTEGMLLAAGPNVSHGAFSHAVHDVDLLPTAFNLLGYETPVELPGKAITLSDASAVADKPLEPIPTTTKDAAWPVDTYDDTWAEVLPHPIDESNEQPLTSETPSDALTIAITRRLQGLEQSYMQVGKYMEALDVLHRMRSLQDTLYVRVRIAECYLALDDMKRAGAVIGRLRKLLSDSPIPTALEAYGRSLRGEHARSSNTLCELLEQHPESPHLWLQYACSLLAEGDHPRAKQWFERALRVSSHRWLPHWGLAQCHKAAGEHGLAQHHAGRCVDLGGPTPNNHPLPMPKILGQLLK